MTSNPQLDLSAQNSRHGSESGFTLGTLVAVIVLIALGCILAFLWGAPASTPTPLPSVTKAPPANDSPANSKSRVGSDSQLASSLDTLSPELLTLREKLDNYFQKTQWDSAMDSSTAHRVARARNELEEFLSGLGPEHVSLLIGLLEEEPDFVNRRFLLKALGKIGTEEALGGLIDHYWWCTQEQKESEVKHTIDALASADNAESFQLLSEFALSEDTLSHRYRFVGALTQSSFSADAVGIYSQLMTDESHFRVRQRAAFGMKISGSLSDVPSIERALQEEINPYVRQSFLGAIGGIRDVNSIPQVRKILQEDEVLSTRISAVRALLRIEGAAAVEALQAALNDDSQPQRVREEAQRALIKLGASG